MPGRVKTDATPHSLDDPTRSGRWSGGCRDGRRPENKKTPCLSVHNKQGAPAT